MISVIYEYVTISVILILIYEILVLKKGIFNIRSSTLILRFIISLIIGPILLIIWFIMSVLAHVSLFVVALCKHENDKGATYIKILQNRYKDLNLMSVEDFMSMKKLLKKSRMINAIVKFCGKLIKVYASVSLFVSNNYI